MVIFYSYVKLPEGIPIFGPIFLFSPTKHNFISQPRLPTWKFHGLFGHKPFEWATDTGEIFRLMWKTRGAVCRVQWSIVPISTGVRHDNSFESALDDFGEHQNLAGNLHTWTNHHLIWPWTESDSQLILKPFMWVCRNVINAPPIKFMVGITS